MPQLIASVEGVEVKSIYLENDRTTLGRKHHNDIVLDSLVVSGNHCVFEFQGLTDVIVEDLGSTNGTFVNGHLIKSRQLLHDRDVINVGDFSLRFLTRSEEQTASNPQETKVISLLASLGHPGTSAVLEASLRLLSGASAGLEVPLVKAVTTFGRPGVSVVAVSHRREGYFVAHMGGKTLPTLNGTKIGQDAVALAHNDILNLAGDELEFLLQEH